MVQPISCDILQNHITQLGAMEPLIYWAGDHCYVGVFGFDSAARVDYQWLEELADLPVPAFLARLS